MEEEQLLLLLYGNSIPHIYMYMYMHSIHDLFLMVLSKRVSLSVCLFRSFSLCHSVHASRLLLVIMFAPKCRKIVDTAAGMRLSASAFVWGWIRWSAETQSCSGTLMGKV